MTTAYFGIRAASNTAQASHMRPEDGTGGGGGGEVPRRP
jgi:hypothetical protein